MNYKSFILKLSIIFMLILVLIPVASAMDSNETFFIEYENSDIEEVVVEYEVEDTASQSCPEKDVEIYDTTNNDFSSREESSNEVIAKESNDQIKMENIEYNHNHTFHELGVDEVSLSRDVKAIETELVHNTDEDFDNLASNIVNADDEDLTFAENSLNQVLFPVFRFSDYIHCLLIDNYYNEFSYNESSFGESEDFMTKFELKEKLLLNHDPHTYFDSHNIYDLKEILCINKITTDFAYCIDNSIVGADSIVNLLSCFSNFKSYFYTIFPVFCYNFLRGADFINCC